MASNRLQLHRFLLLLQILPCFFCATTWARRLSYRQPVCSSWRYNEEVNNLRGWSAVPDACESYVEEYMTGSGYKDDSKLATQAAIEFAESYNVNGSYLAWVFDIDETSLSNLPYFAKHRFGADGFDDTLFNTWVLEAAAPPLESSLELFNRLKELGFVVFFLTGRSESYRNVTIHNLRSAGYSGWEGLILRQTEDLGLTALKYKSQKRKALEDLGYTIVGNIGDQWSDISGYSAGQRVFKLPNPMYYIS